MQRSTSTALSFPWTAARGPPSSRPECPVRHLPSTLRGPGGRVKRQCCPARDRENAKASENCGIRGAAFQCPGNERWAQYGTAEREDQKAARTQGKLFAW